MRLGDGHLVGPQHWTPAQLQRETERVVGKHRAQPPRPGVHATPSPWGTVFAYGAVLAIIGMVFALTWLTVGT